MKTGSFRVRWQPLVGLVAGVVVMSRLVVSGQELKHVPPAAPSFVVLHTFAGPSTDGAVPEAGLIPDPRGNLYGTAPAGGGSDSGVVFELSPTGIETVLHSFTGGADGARPFAGLIRDASGNLYGTSLDGAAYSSACEDRHCGVVFKLSLAGTLTVLLTFTGGADGGNSLGGLIRDLAGNLYGTTMNGGDTSACPSQGCGVVFELIRCDSTPPGYDFKVLYTFTGGADGGRSQAGLTQDGAGNLYGTTPTGGAFKRCDGGCGTVFRLSPTGTKTVLHSFAGYPTDGAGPLASLIRDSTGNLYGTTYGGGASAHGMVFKLSRSGTETVLHSFTGGAGGAFPTSGLTQDAVGNLYGTAPAGGPITSACPTTCGVVFRLTP